MEIYSGDLRQKRTILKRMEYSSQEENPLERGLLRKNHRKAGPLESLLALASLRYQGERVFHISGRRWDAMSLEEALRVK